MSEEIVSHTLTDIPFSLSMDTLLKRTHIKAGSSSAADLDRIAKEGAALARPKALYLVAYISNRGDDFVEIEGRRFDSRVLRVNLDKAFRVFPFLATCGSELQSWAEGYDDMVERFWAESLKELALGAAVQALNAHIDQHYRPGQTTAMNPGSLEDWPLQQQTVLFNLISAHPQIGVHLTDSLLMIPTKTVSGIRFPTTEHFESCQLCPRENCPGRRSPYDAGLFESRYQINGPDSTQ